MLVQTKILKLYDSVMKRVYRWVFPFIILVLFLLAFIKDSELFSVYISAIGLFAIHTLFGFLFIIILFLFLYDCIYRSITADEEKPSSNGKKKALLPETLRLKNYSTAVNIIFFFFCVALSILGVLIYGVMRLNWQSLIPYYTLIRSAHLFLGWLFLSVVVIKYYLAITKWARNLIYYLREE